MIEKDFIIVGSWIAGLSAAFFAAQKWKVTLITKWFDLRDSKSFQSNDWVIFSKNLDILHSDISKASHWFENKEKVDFFIENVNWVFYFLRDVLWVNFFSEWEKIFWYSEKNIFFSWERTWEEICKKFISQIEKNPNIEIFLETEVSELISEKIEEREARKEFIWWERVFWVVWKNLETWVEKKFFWKNVLIATWSWEWIHDFDYLSDWIKLTKSVWAKIWKMNSVSWNPLCLDIPNLQKYFLPLQILNYWAFLINENWEKFLQKYIENEDFYLSNLSDAFFLESKKSVNWSQKIFLDLRHKSKNFWEEKFPELTSFLKFQKIDISKDVLPLKNIQQFLIWWIEVSEKAKTSIQWLYVSWELANFWVLWQNWLPWVLTSKSIILSKSFVDWAVL